MQETKTNKIKKTDPDKRVSSRTGSQYPGRRHRCETQQEMTSARSMKL